MVLRSATKDENVPRPRTLIMVAARERPSYVGSEDAAAAKSWIMRHPEVGRDQADEKTPDDEKWSPRD